MNVNEKETIYYDQLSMDGWTMYIATTEKGLCFVGSQAEGYDAMKDWFARHRPRAVLIEDLNKVIVYKEQLVEYLRGERKVFDLQVDLIGTEFQTAVWDELQKIPFGETTSYSNIAEQINRPTSVRAVGTAIGANPVLIVVPCHRVISKSGKMGGYRGGISMKESLLQLEK
ncbi:methylated-DNA--[protein]-cysteine S-methyltransferase [Oceanobacillus sp. CF4.6]|uniref:methylated-DNA--[protein]-cysteine S-methyltransferase n=1 Tax=Oceanobacillus sp. CF4.6 TaxID=3373080 RepID=UPI003EE5B37C